MASSKCDTTTNDDVVLDSSEHAYIDTTGKVKLRLCDCDPAAAEKENASAIACVLSGERLPPRTMWVQGKVRLGSRCTIRLSHRRLRAYGVHTTPVLAQSAQQWRAISKSRLLIIVPRQVHVLWMAQTGAETSWTAIWNSFGVHDEIHVTLKPVLLSTAIE